MNVSCEGDVSIVCILIHQHFLHGAGVPWFIVSWILVMRCGYGNGTSQ